MGEIGVLNRLFFYYQITVAAVTILDGPRPKELDINTFLNS